MTCQTCNHDMQPTGCEQSGQPFRWCARCGTIRTCDGNVARPALVDMCRSFYDEIPTKAVYAWNRSGIMEAIQK